MIQHPLSVCFWQSSYTRVIWLTCCCLSDLTSNTPQLEFSPLNRLSNQTYNLVPVLTSKISSSNPPFPAWFCLVNQRVETFLGSRSMNQLLLWLDCTENKVTFHTRHSDIWLNLLNCLNAKEINSQQPFSNSCFSPQNKPISAGLHSEMSIEWFVMWSTHVKPPRIPFTFCYLLMLSLHSH